MDISDTLAPSSDQLDAVDLLGGPMTFTIDKVTRNNDDQPLNVHLKEFPRVWRPGKSMRRVLAYAWGTDASKYAGRQVTLYCDPDVRFGKDKVGGTRISHLSHIDKPKSMPLLVSRGKSELFTVQPMPKDRKPAPAPEQQGQQNPEPTAEDVAAATDRDVLGKWWRVSSPARRKQIEARVAELWDAPAATEQPQDTLDVQDPPEEPEGWR